MIKDKIQDRVREIKREKILRIMSLRKEGKSLMEISKAIGSGYSSNTVSRILKMVQERENAQKV